MKPSDFGTRFQGQRAKRVRALQACCFQLESTFDDDMFISLARGKEGSVMRLFDGSR